MNDSSRGRSKGRIRAAAFATADGMFLSAVGAVATLVMHWTHESDWPLAVCMLVGMAAAMVVQTVMALLATPLLGAIETMVPSMAVAMIAPMSVCLFHMVGREPAMGEAILMGACFGVGMFVFLLLHGAICRRRVSRFVPANWGPP
ncbi:MAG: hypothetical protein HY719_17555 [Planctomycetes bacterium]|nr:hypothetical protein [Planctomycetota bacterium]